MKVAAIQHDIVWEDASATHAHVTPLIAEAAGAGAQLIVLAEMFATGFSMHPEKIAENEGGLSEQFLRNNAREHGVHLIASVAQRGPDGAYRNNAIVASPDGSVQRYAKIHPFSYAGEDEKYAAGRDFLTVEIEDVRTTVFVCYDLRFADEFWVRALETDLYVVVANWPAPRVAHWSALLTARAIENQAYVLGVNRVGEADGSRYVGASALIDPMGHQMTEPIEDECTLFGDVEPEQVVAIRAKFPFLADRR